MKERNYRFDNLKLILIILVIFGHLLELFKGQSIETNKLYLIIYTFHMPLFIFITGIFAKFSKKKVFSLIFTYSIFQIIYRRFDLYLFNPTGTFTLTFTTPYWLLWYIFTITLYTILIPIIDTKNNVSKAIIIAIVTFLSFIANKEKSIGYYLSISRFFTFLPYFVLGFYFKDYINIIETKVLNNKAIKYILLSIFTILVLLCSNYIIINNEIHQNMLYGSYSYESANYNIEYKIVFMLIAFSWIIFLYLLTPNIKINYISILGSNTFTIYLFHGFFVKYLQSERFFIFDINTNLYLSLLISIILVIFFGNKYISKVLRFIFCGDFFIFIYKKLFIKTEKQ